MTTNDEQLYNYLLTARNHGLVSRDECAFFSVNSRLDTLQAVILNVKLKYINTWNERRREIAHMYDKGLRDLVKVPELNDDEYAVFHTYIIQTERRDELMEFLASKGIESKIHYPIAIHKQQAWMDIYPNTPSFKETEKQSEMILSLPVFPELSNDQIEYVIESIQGFFK